MVGTAFILYGYTSEYHGSSISRNQNLLKRQPKAFIFSTMPIVKYPYHKIDIIFGILWCYIIIMVAVSLNF